VTPAKKEAPNSETSEGPLGLPSAETILGFQTEVFKELINKFAWALGSTYRAPYSNQRTAVRQLAIRLAKAVVHGQGYPQYMAKK